MPIFLRNLKYSINNHFSFLLLNFYSSRLVEMNLTAITWITLNTQNLQDSNDKHAHTKENQERRRWLIDFYPASIKTRFMSIGFTNWWWRKNTCLTMYKTAQSLSKILAKFLIFKNSFLSIFSPVFNPWSLYKVLSLQTLLTSSIYAPRSLAHLSYTVWIYRLVKLSFTFT